MSVVCYQIFGVWQMQTMWKLQKNVWFLQRNKFLSGIFTTELIIAFFTTNLSRKIVHGVKTQWLSSKEKVPGAVVMSTVFLGMKAPITIDFLKSANVNGVSYCQLFRQYFTLYFEWPSYVKRKRAKYLSYAVRKECIYKSYKMMRAHVVRINI